MALIFDGSDGRHAYMLDGAQAPSVTQVIAAAGLIQLDHIPSFILDQAKARGTAVHQLVHYDNEGDLDESSIDPRWRGYLEGWRAYRTERQATILLCEHRLASRRHQVAGTLDCLCTIAGEGWLLDFATGDPADVAKDLQTAAYLGLALEWAAEDPVLDATLRQHPHWRRGAVRLLADGSFRMVEYRERRDYPNFLTLAAAYHLRVARGVRLSIDDCAA